MIEITRKVAIYTDDFGPSPFFEDLAEFHTFEAVFRPRPDLIAWVAIE
jgi:hypothetical protein